MTNSRIRIDGRRFYLARSQDTAELKRQIVDAVRAGGGFVRLCTAEGEEIDVLVTPYTTLLVEEAHRTAHGAPAYLGELVPVGATLAQPDSDYEADEALLV
jgi:hypothetical protein